MIIFVSRRRYRRNSRSGPRWYARTWLIPAGLTAAILFAIWPLLAFRHHWTTVQAIPCYPDAWVRYGAVCSGMYAAPVTHSGVSELGIGLTAAWLGALLVLVVIAVARRG
jgi:hypothetical protein